MFIRRNIFCTLLFAVCMGAYGQSDIFLTQQWFSRINMNPAATGNSNNVDVFLLNRQQWAGFDNAPKTSVLNAHSYFNTIQSGLGLSVVYDKLGVSHKTFDIQAAYAYHLEIDEQTMLSFGLSGGVYNSNWDPKANTVPVLDPELDTEKDSKTSPDFNAGIELYAYGITAGASVTHLTGKSTDNSVTGKPGREYYGYMRYRWVIDRYFDIIPGIIYRNGNRSNFFDFNLTGFYMKKYWLGASFRPDNAFAVMLGAELGMFRFGYAYDRSVGETASLAANTHEVVLSVRIRKPQTNKRRTPRFLD